MKVEDTISTLQKLREENADDWKTVVENGKEEERNEESSLICDYFMHSSIERERLWLDVNRGEWIARRMEMITQETEERFLGMGVEYRVNEQAVEKKATISAEKIKELLLLEQCVMELLLVYEVNKWEKLFWDIFKTFLDQIGDDRVEVKESLLREWRTNFWKRLDPQMHASEKRLAEFKLFDINKKYYLDILREWWASCLSQFFDGVEQPNSISLSKLRRQMEPSIGEETRTVRSYGYEMRLRMEKEIEDIEFRFSRGSESVLRFDQFWDDDALFRCRYSRSKWFNLSLSSITPLEIYSHALKGNKNIIHITFAYRDSDASINADLPQWVTSISRSSGCRPTIHRDLLFIKSPNNDLIKFAKEVGPKLDLFSTYIFTDADIYDLYSDKLGNNARVF